jgi:hypothetical protein
MHRAILLGTILAVSLVGAGCEQSAPPPESEVFPTPQYVTQEPEGPMTRITGYAWDPEAYLLSLFGCGGPACPLPPILLDNSPLVLRSMVVGASVTVLDTQDGREAVPPGLSDMTGTWVLPKVPSREAPAYLVRAAGQGTLAEVPFPLPPLPPGNYLPTVTQRPVYTRHSLCAAIEANHLSDKGILEALAKYLTDKGTPTTPADLIDPQRYAGVVIFWLYNPGFPYWRLPATSPLDVTGGTGIKLKVEGPGQVLTVDWAPPGALPPPVAPLQSTRGFVVFEFASESKTGLTAVLYPAGSNPGEVTYEVKDTITDPLQLRPWTHPDVKATPRPGVITFVPIQLYFNGETPPKITPPSNCLP